MTTLPATTDADGVIDFGPDPESTPSADDPTRVLRFRLALDPTDPESRMDPAILVAIRPKTARLLDLAAGVPLDAITSGSVENLAAAGMLGVWKQVMEEILDEESYAYLDARLKDREDTLDLTHMGPTMEVLQERWFGGPTGSRSGSPKQRPRSGKKSTVNKR